MPAFIDLSSFTCDECRGKRDSVCPRCSDWETVVGGPAGAKVLEAVTVLGRYVDAAASNAGLMKSPKIEPAPLPAISSPSAAEPTILQNKGAAAVGTAAEPAGAPVLAIDEATQRMQQDGTYLHIAFQRPYVVGGSSEEKGRALFQERFERLEARFRREEGAFLSDGMFPVRISDATSSDSVVEPQLQAGLIHSLVWCAQGSGSFYWS